MSVDKLIDSFLRASGVWEGKSSPAFALGSERQQRRRSLLPWQLDVLALVGDENDQMNEVTATAPWTWAKAVVLDTDVLGGMKSVQALVTRLGSNGEEFAIDAFRPRPTLSLADVSSRRRPAPRPYRFVVVTWGAFLGMTREEIANEMLRRYHDGAGDSNASTAPADGSTTSA